MSRHLIVLPDDSPKAFLKAIAKAKESLRIKMFIFSDPAMRKAVIAAHKRGVEVRVMLNPVRRDGTGENKATRAALLAAGVEVMDSNPKFPVTHEKSMVVDSKALDDCRLTVVQQDSRARSFAELGYRKFGTDPRLLDSHKACARGPRGDRRFRSRLAPPSLRPGRRRAHDLGGRQCARANRQAH